MPCYSACSKRFPNVENRNEGAGRAKTAVRSTFSSMSMTTRAKLPNYMCPTKSSDECEIVKAAKAAANAKRNRPKAQQQRQQQQQTQHTVQVCAKELERLREASKATNLHDHHREASEMEAEIRYWTEESERIRRQFKKIDDERKKKAEKIALERQSEEVEDKIKVLEKSFLAKHEQEEEVKAVNRIILNAKCHAVRDAQIQEKSKLAKETRQEQIRLEKAVIENAQSFLNDEDKNFEKKLAMRTQYAEEIRKQIKERENLHFLEAESVEREGKIMRELQENVKRAEEKEQQEARERRIRFREELGKVVEMSVTFKRMVCEQERLADMKIAAYIRDRDERLRKLALEKKLQKEEFERTQTRLFNLAQKALESHSQREEMNYLRAREHLEREYRRKEKEAAIKKQQLEQDLIKVRERQVQETRHRQALQIARADEEFHKLLERMKSSENEDRKIEIEREKRNKCYRQDIIKQMGDKEMERRRLLEIRRSEASYWRERERQRSADIKAVVRAKLNAMRDACLPEKYVRDVEMQLKRIANSRSALSK